MRTGKEKSITVIYRIYDCIYRKAKDYIGKVLELSKDFNKVAEYKMISFKINIKKSIELLHTRNRHLEYTTFKNTT